MPTFKELGFNQVWSVSRGIAAPAGLPKNVQDTLTAALEKTLGSSEHQQKARQLSLEPRVIKGDEVLLGAPYVFTKENVDRFDF